MIVLLSDSIAGIVTHCDSGARHFEARWQMRTAWPIRSRDRIATVTIDATSTITGDVAGATRG